MSSFSFVSRNFLISSLISLLIHSLFNSMLFSLHEFECFWVFSLRLISSFKTLSEKLLNMILIFLNLMSCFVSYHVVYLWKCSMYIWKECVFCFFGMKGYWSPLNKVFCLLIVNCDPNLQALPLPSSSVTLLSRPWFIILNWNLILILGFCFSGWFIRNSFMLWI